MYIATAVDRHERELSQQIGCLIKTLPVRCEYDASLDIATIGKSTMGYFYSFKLHLIVNEIGEVLDFQITQANVDDRTPLKNGNLLKKI